MLYSEIVLTQDVRIETMRVLEERFHQKMSRHEGINWEDVKKKLAGKDPALHTLYWMEATGGEPDVIARECTASTYAFFDCSEQSPVGRRNLCYDREALDKRKENKPRGCVQEMAVEMGIEVLSEEQYTELQKYGSFDTKTSSWIRTPEKMRRLGGALFCDRRYDRVFLYHNSAESYYAVRGFRGCVTV